MQWSVVITTAPRKPSTLNECLESIINCGWEPTLFAEPNSEQTPYPTILHPRKRGVWHNWLDSCKYALTQSPDFILTSQDDSFYHPDSKEFIEKLIWPKNCGFVSLYTPKHYSTRRLPGVNRIYTRSLWGACALVWKPEVLEQVINHRIALNWLGARPRSKNKNVILNRKKNPYLIANSDTAIGKICNALKLGMYFVDPSPVSHIATTSTINHGGNLGRRNASRLADHSLPLDYQVCLSR